MSKQTSNVPLMSVFIVMCYQNIVGVYARQETAYQAQQDLINRGRPADVFCRCIVYPEIPE